MRTLLPGIRLKRLLIANRAEIAHRIARTAAELGIPTLGIHAPEDALLAQGYGTDALAVLEGQGPSAYLDVSGLCALAQRHGCDAVHPGYGFLSESAAFARALEAAGATLVGPSAETLDRFGDKAAARVLAESLDVPVLPATQGSASLDDTRALLASLPPGSGVMLKACAGAGGRGMRAVRRASDLEEAYARCGSEAERAFGSGALLAERLLERARHLEVQIVGDIRGAVSHLWERECSLQRSHQKLVERAPSPRLAPALREALIGAALAMAGATEFRGVGTFEFLVDASGDYFFLEANPRLQVEHTVTEEITGVDLVETQLRLAGGESLGSLGLASPPPVRGHAIQARICAESIDREGHARPSGGEITAFEVPGGPGVRVDTAMRQGLAPHPAFDSLLAKLIVSSASPDPARTEERLRRALRDFRIEGPTTNLAFLSALAARPEFASGGLWTTFVADCAAELFEAAAALSASGESARADARLGQAKPAERPTPPGCEPVVAPMIGTLIELRVATGDSVQAGEPLCVLEAMKMEHLIPAPVSGRVREVLVAVGDVLAEAAAIAFIDPSGERPGDAAQNDDVDLDRVRPDLAELRARQALLQDESRPDAVARRRERGQRTARENLDALCDPGSFIEYGGLALAAMRRTRPMDELRRKTPADGILTGFGTVNADLFGPEAARCAALVVDATVVAGTQGFFHHRKIDRVLELAERQHTPVVFFPEGGGGRPNDSDPVDLVAAGLQVTSFQAFARLSGKVPRVSVVSGFCFAGSAALAGCADVIIATRGASLGMGGPAMIEGGGLGSYAPEAVGPISVLEPNGVVDLVVEDEIEAAAAARRYLAYFQGPTPAPEPEKCADPRLLRHAIPENRRRVYEIRKLIEILCDPGSVLELRRAWGRGMITAVVRIEGRAFGLLANDPMHLGGAIDDEGSEKAARFLQLCDAFGLPVLSLCDTPGFMVGPEIEARGQVRKTSRLFTVGANLSVPLFTVVLRKAYGLGAQAMAGGSFAAPSFIVSWPTGELGGMGLEGAVRLGFRQQLAGIEDEGERDQLFQKLVAALYEKGKALNAASLLELDAVIDPAETRAWIRRGLVAAGPIGNGSKRFVDTW